jgi:hypothetical protein
MAGNEGHGSTVHQPVLQRNLRIRAAIRIDVASRNEHC